MVNYKRDGGQNLIAYVFPGSRIYKCTIVGLMRLREVVKWPGEDVQSLGITDGKWKRCIVDKGRNLSSLRTSAQKRSKVNDH